MKTLATLLIALMLLLPGLALAQGIKIITNEENPYSEVSRDMLRDYFLKKSKHWPNGTPVRFFDRMDESFERNVFLRDYVRRSQREVETFWIGQKINTGHSAPTQISSDSMVASLVARFPGAIGYVSPNFTGAKGVKVIEVR